MSVSKFILKKVKLVELKMRQRVKDLFVGGYQSAFKGQGMVFSDYRTYIPGDDVRSINWPVTAKMGEAFINIFEEERGATFLLVVDISASFDFGTNSFKGEIACELASLIALSAQSKGDRVGLLLFSDRVEHYVPPASGSKHALRIVRDLYSFDRKSVKTDITSSLDFLNGLLKKRCHIFLFSDFFMKLSFSKRLKIMTCRHDVVAGLIRDPLENRFLPLGLMELEDIETGKRMTVDTSSPSFLESYKNMMQNELAEVKKTLSKCKVDCFQIQTNKDIFNQLMSFFKKRSKRR